jgi:hypothetical protein
MAARSHRFNHNSLSYNSGGGASAVNQRKSRSHDAVVFFSAGGRQRPRLSFFSILQEVLDGCLLPDEGVMMAQEFHALSSDK